MWEVSPWLQETASKRQHSGSWREKTSEAYSDKCSQQSESNCVSDGILDHVQSVSAQLAGADHPAPDAQSSPEERQHLPTRCPKGIIFVCPARCGRLRLLQPQAARGSRQIWRDHRFVSWSRQGREMRRCGDDPASRNGNSLPATGTGAHS